MKRLAFGLAVVLASALVSSASGRLTRVWKDSELWSEADVVVLATPRSTKDVVIPGESRPENWIDVETTLDAQAVLKGKAGGTIVFRHARYAEGAIPVPNGPIFVKLDPERQQFLLFLKRAKDGALEPLSGQMDAHDSVRWVQPYGAIR
jgi:hypothetical protein